jgi:DNA-binding CsgD family transcriptional regulator
MATGVSSETLTGRELAVLTLLARGKSNKEIRANLFITETTAKGHLHHIFTKLNVLSRMEAVTVASQRGLVQLYRLNLWLLPQGPADRRLDLLPDLPPPEGLHWTSSLALLKSDRLANSWRLEEVSCSSCKQHRTKKQKETKHMNNNNGHQKGEQS